MSLRNHSAVASRWAKRWFPGRPDQVTRAREFVRQVMGSLPVAEDAVLLVSELSTNAVLHTASGDGGAFEVAVHVSTACARIEVRDQGSEDHPTAEPAETLAEAGRGLSLVELISTRWGHTANDNGRSVFFELSWEDAD